MNACEIRRVMPHALEMYQPMWWVFSTIILAIAVAQLPPPIIAIFPQLNICLV